MPETTDTRAAAAYGELVSRAWRDPAFKARLIADLAAVLKDGGVAVPPGVAVKVVENSAKHIHLVLPAKPARGGGDEDLRIEANTVIGMTLITGAAVIGFAVPVVMALGQKKTT